MATAGNTDQANMDDCMVCDGKYHEPRALICRHYFCKVCIENTWEDGRVKCPDCEHVTEIPEKIGVNDLEKYLVYNSMLCDIQHQDGEGFQSFCLQCSTICCPPCAMNDHKGHDIESIETAGDKARQRIKRVIKKMGVDDRATKFIEILLENGRYLEKTFKESITNIKEQLRTLLQRVDTIEAEIGGRLADNIRTIETMSSDMKEYMGPKVKVKRHLRYLIDQTSNPEVVGSEFKLPKYENSTYKQVLKTKIIDVPDFVTKLRDIQTELDKCQKDLDIGFVKHNIECDHDTPLANLSKISGISAGNNIYGLAVDSVRERLVVRRWDTTAPITVYDFQGQQLQVLGKDVEGIAGYRYQEIAIDTKRDLCILPMTDGSLVTMDMNGEMKDKIIVTDDALLGVSYSKTDRYVTSRKYPYEVYIVNPQNKQILTTTVTLSYPYNLHCGSITCKGEATSVIIISNYGRYCIKVLDMSGHLLHTYGKEGKSGQGDGELEYPEGVCIDPGGRIIVCDRSNNRVVSFWSEGDKDKWEVLLDDDKLSGGYHPTVVCDPVTRRLFVGDSDSTDIQVFQG